MAHYSVTSLMKTLMNGMEILSEMEWMSLSIAGSLFVLPLSIKNLLLRGTSVKNTEFAFGIVVYVGMETKIMKNQKKSPTKISNIFRKMNYMLYTVFLFQLVIIVTLASLSLKWQQSWAGKHFYLNLDGSTSGGTWFVQLLTYWVTFSHMIPISLYVIIELLKLGQAYLVNNDMEMYNHDNLQFAKCRNSDLIEELGQVQIVFSDKTGTLTMNKMEFKMCSINGKIYGKSGVRNLT
jgi:phospholipid-transporting ATPase